MRRLPVVIRLIGLLACLVGVAPATALALTGPVVITGAASQVGSDSATVAGTVNPATQPTTYAFDYGTSTAYGHQTPVQMLPAGPTDVSVSAPLAGLAPSTTYHFRVTATNATGTTTGLDQTFTTLGPSAVTGPATGVSSTAATLTGTVNPRGAPSTYYFEYGATTAYGQPTPPQPAGSGTADVPAAAAVGGLAPATVYHYRLAETRVAAGSAATTLLGADQTFVTPGTPAASALDFSVSPAGGDTDLTTTLTIGSDPAGTPHGQVTVIAEALASAFVNQLGSFGVCPAASFANPQGPTPANCADRSAIVGTGQLVTRGPSGGDTTSDQGVIVKTGENRLAFWWHTPAAGGVVAAFGVAPAAVSQETGPFGPVVTFDLTSLPAGARVKALGLDFQRNGVTGKAPFAAPAACGPGPRAFQARIVYAGGVAPEVAASTGACVFTPPEAPQPSKLQLARATITGRVIDILAPISRRASGTVSIELYAAGQRSRWTAAINSTDARIRDTHLLPAAQANNGGTGILTITYAGNAVTRPQVVRLRAGNVPAVLDAARPTLDSTGHLSAHGTISPRAHGVVRVQLEYFSGGRTTTLESYARIAGGAWSLAVTLTPAQQAAIAARQGTVHSYILFTGYFPLRMRGEMISYQVLGAP